MGHFKDFGAGNDVTRRGRDLIQRAVAELEAGGAQVIEVDTDGIYFVPPTAAADDRAADTLLEQGAAIRPQGIRPEIDGRYAARFSSTMNSSATMNQTCQLTILLPSLHT